MASSRKSPSIDDPRQAILEAVGLSLARHVSLGQLVTVGFSGGLDSLVLLHALTTCRNENPAAFRLSALHVHHGISVNAEAWATFCQDCCEQLAIPFSCVRVAVERESKDALEAAARRARHGAFADANADWLMLAHQRDDQAETMIFNLLRGTGLAGVAAMREHRGRLLRPLLAIGRADIEAYARQHDLEWIEDESNADIRHSRNFLRQRIFPELSGRFPGAAKNIAGAAARFAEVLELLDDLACMDLRDHAEFPVNLEILRGLGEARARNALRYLLARHQVMIPSEARLREALRQLLSAAPDRHPALMFGQHCLRRRDSLIYLESLPP